MAILGLVTGFSSSRVAHSVPMRIVRDPRLNGVAAGGLIFLILLIALALVWQLMTVDVRRWALSYALAYAAGMLAASYGRAEKNIVTVTGPPNPAWRWIRIVPRVFVAVLLLAGPLYLLVASLVPGAETLITLICMALALLLTIALQRLRCPACGRRFFGPGAYWSDRCASCRVRRPEG